MKSMVLCLLVLGFDTLECIVSKPVSEADAIALAKEQYAFCSDIVEQGMGSISALAEELKQSTVWYFWWELRKPADTTRSRFKKDFS